MIWPALLLALGEPVPAGILGHGWLNVGGEKISKSRGNTVDPLPLIERYGVDAVRYYLLREMPFGPDGNYSEEGLVHRTNTDLANDLGNLLSRTTMMIQKFVRGVVPAPGAGDGVLEAAAAQAVRAVEQHMERLQPADALAALFRLVSRANKYIEEQSPWSLAKKPAEAERLGGVPAGTQIRRGAPLFPRIQE